MPEPLVIDTCAMRDKPFRHWLRSYHGRKIIPAVAYTELSVFLVGKKRKTQEKVDALLHSLGIEIEWYRHGEARKAVECAIQYGEFDRNFRDYMIASHAYTAPWIVVTYNTKDFEYLNRRVKTPVELMNRRC